MRILTVHWKPRGRLPFCQWAFPGTAHIKRERSRFPRVLDCWSSAGWSRCPWPRIWERCRHVGYGGPLEKGIASGTIRSSNAGCNCNAPDSSGRREKARHRCPTSLGCQNIKSSCSRLFFESRPFHRLPQFPNLRSTYLGFPLWASRIGL